MFLTVKAFFLHMSAVVAADGVIIHEADGDAFLLHVKSGRYFGLNKSGVVIWQAIVEGHDPVKALAERWPGTPEDRLREDVSGLVTRLREAELVQDDAAAG